MYQDACEGYSPGYGSGDSVSWARAAHSTAASAHHAATLMARPQAPTARIAPPLIAQHTHSPQIHPFYLYLTQINSPSETRTMPPSYIPLLINFICETYHD